MINMTNYSSITLSKLPSDSVIDITPVEDLDKTLASYIDSLDKQNGIPKPKIYAGYEAGHYFLRLENSNIPLMCLNDALHSGYQMQGRHSLLLKKR